MSSRAKLMALAAAEGKTLKGLGDKEAEELRQSARKERRQRNEVRKRRDQSNRLQPFSPTPSDLSNADLESLTSSVSSIQLQQDEDWEPSPCKTRRYILKS